MSSLRVSLFGKFCIWLGDRKLDSIGARKLQELFCYLLLFRDRSHPRELLAGLFWGDSSIAQSKKYLRQALWQLQSTLNQHFEKERSPFLSTESDWVRLDPKADLWLDVAEFERAFALAKGKPGRELGAKNFDILVKAVDLYQGDLLEGCYQDWCLFERERLQNMFLASLDKLMDYCEANQEYETGLDYGSQILRYDYTRERTHRRLMRLHFMAGNRTEALHQYERCVHALREELDVQPSRRTVHLYEQIRSDLLEERTQQSAPSRSAEISSMPLSEILARLRQLHLLFFNLQEEIQEDIRLVERSLNGKR